MVRNNDEGRECSDEVTETEPDKLTKFEPGGVTFLALNLYLVTIMDRSLPGTEV